VGQGSEFALLLPETLSANTPVADKIPTVTTTPRFYQEKKFHSAEIIDDREHASPQDAVILLIDDDPLFGQALLEINRKQGYKTLLAATGKEGLDLAQRYHPNGILLDLGLPDMDGTAVLHELKTQHELLNIPVYIVSAREKDAALLQEGILGYLQKPVYVQQINDAEAKLLAFIRQTATQTILVVENGNTTTEQIAKLVEKQLARVLKCSATADMKTLLARHSCYLSIINLDDLGVTQALSVAKNLREINASMNFVFLGQQALNDDEEGILRQYSDSIIIKAPQSEQRLLKNIERFLDKASHSSAESNFAISKNQSCSDRLLGRHILVVDDDARNLFVITAALEKEGAKVSGVLNGKRALEFLQQQKVDMVFMDIMMPEMDGYQTITNIRKNPDLVKIPVVVLTAKALSSDREKALAAGADDYLAKPADYDVLIRMAIIWCASKH
jgi:CheY-like chemotaxis protein